MTNSRDIPDQSYFTGEIDGHRGLFCKPHDSRIVYISSEEPISWVDQKKIVLGYTPVKNIKFKEKPTEILVSDIPSGTVFTGTHAYETGRFLKLADGGLLGLDRYTAWGAYCATNTVSEYKPIDLEIKVSYDND